MLCRAPRGSVVKRGNHGKHGRARAPGKARARTHRERDRLEQGSLFHSAAL